MNVNPSNGHCGESSLLPPPPSPFHLFVPRQRLIVSANKFKQLCMFDTERSRGSISCSSEGTVVGEDTTNPGELSVWTSSQLEAPLHHCQVW